MTAKEIVRSIMAVRNIRNADLASRLGISTQAAWDRTHGKDREGREKDLSAGNLSDMVRAMDYKVVVMPRGAKLPADSYEIE